MQQICGEFILQFFCANKKKVIVYEVMDQFGTMFKVIGMQLVTEVSFISFNRL